jgi:hypothetical protein
MMSISDGTADHQSHPHPALLRGVEDVEWIVQISEPGTAITSADTSRRSDEHLFKQAQRAMTGLRFCDDFILMSGPWTESGNLPPSAPAAIASTWPSTLSRPQQYLLTEPTEPLPDVTACLDLLGARYSYQHIIAAQVRNRYCHPQG